MKQKHGRPTSYCCGAKLRCSQRGSWDEYKCSKCGADTDDDGQKFTYLVRDPYRAESKA